jgi:hypothetical protein
LEGVIAALEGDGEKALIAIKKIEDAKMGEVSLNYIGYVYHALGDLDSYFEYMKSLRSPYNNSLNADVLVPLRKGKG